MVYMPPGITGWRPFARSWLLSLPLQPRLEDQPPSPEDLPTSNAAQKGQPSQLQSGDQTAGRWQVALKQQAAVADKQTALHQGGTPGGAAAHQLPQESQEESEEAWQLAGAGDADLAPVQEFIWSLMEVFIDPLLEWVRARGREAVPTVDVALVQGVTTLLGHLLQNDGCVRLMQRMIYGMSRA